MLTYRRTEFGGKVRKHQRNTFVIVLYRSDKKSLFALWLLYICKYALSV